MRLAFSIAINVDADILLIDEILAVGDQHFQDKCFKKLDELKKQKEICVKKNDYDEALNIYNEELKINKMLKKNECK